MSEYLKQEKSFNIYRGYNMAVFVPRESININFRIYYHSDFELLYHKTAEIVKKHSVTAIFIERNFLQDISKALFKKEDVIFQPENIKLDENTQGLLELFIKEVKDRQAGYKLILKSLSVQIAINLLRQAGSYLQVTKERLHYTEKENINRVIDYFLEHYDEDYSLEVAAKIANLSPYYFIRVFKAETGKTPYEYLLDIKIKKAKELFESKGYKVTEVCFLCGFSNVSYFSTVFKKKVGTSPAEYRKLVS